MRQPTERNDDLHVLLSEFPKILYFLDGASILVSSRAEKDAIMATGPCFEDERSAWVAFDALPTDVKLKFEQYHCWPDASDLRRWIDASYQRRFVAATGKER